MVTVMREFVISTDATCDLPKAFVEENRIAVIPMRFSLNNTEYLSEGEPTLTPKEFYSMVRKGSMPKTALITPEESATHFERLVKEGKNVLHLAFSSALSGSCGSAMSAAADVMERYPGSKVIVIDSLCASLGEGLYVYYAVQYQKSGMTLEATAQKLEGIKQNLCHYFTVDDLNHLHRGGRVSKATAVLGSVLGIKPVLHVDEEGRLIPIGKVRGRKQSLNQLVEKMKSKISGMENPIFFISHGDCEEDAKYVADLVRKECGIKKHLIGDIGPVIGAHSGPGTVAVFFLGESRKEK